MNAASKAARTAANPAAKPAAKPAADYVVMCSSLYHFGSDADGVLDLAVRRELLLEGVVLLALDEPAARHDA